MRAAKQVVIVVDVVVTEADVDIERRLILYKERLFVFTWYVGRYGLLTYF